MRFKPSVWNNPGLHLKVLWRCVPHCLLKMWVEIGIDGAGKHLPDHCSEQLFTSLAKTLQSLPVDIGETPFTIQRIIQIGNALKDRDNLLSRLAQRLNRFI